ncbi:hypothetical protein FOPE_09786 [Fonsecaea pedrosoi]|nr:hypothetical protein FOPE_09786 [Fonsecaea pedrosoi]
MQSVNSTSRPMAVKPIFVRSHDAAAKTPSKRQPVPPPNTTKPGRVDRSEGRGFHRISKVRGSDRKKPEPSSILADKFTESLEQYRENVQIESTSMLDEAERKLIGGLTELSVNIESHFRGLAEIEEPLQRPLATEALTKVSNGTGNQGAEGEVLLKDRIMQFRALREEKEDVLSKLWKEWEDIQFDLIRLAVEAFGKQSLLIVQLQDRAMKPGQQERLENTLDSAQKIHDEIHHQHAQLEQDMTGFEETIGQISNRTKKAAADMQQQYNVQKSKLFKGLMQSIEQLAAL